MRILFTGASSFTGCWFVRTLADAGHDVVCTMQRSCADDYDGIRRQRVAIVEKSASSIVYNTSFGSEAFTNLVRDAGPWHVFVHHSADVTDYKSPAFDIVKAVGRNTNHAREVIVALREARCQRMVMTGSIFEHGEGAGSEDLPAFSPYGVSKALSGQIFQYYASVMDVALGKFVIPNPFGPYEEPRFTNYLMKSWFAGETPEIRTPDYIRDNIHVSLMAKAHTRFVESMAEERIPSFQRLNPSGYIESQGEFALRFAREMNARLGIESPVKFAKQTDFSEPRIRINTDPVSADSMHWSESEAWDEIAAFYEAQYAAQASG